ncbi:ribosomal RNA methyltransferase, putative [Entamoeba dispar SAW760]|uniref:Putative rRNA methyltransferase n=1 Tax=Entamoeba dispar (strain ATCC PRA-260 / SAW760) TaxID=370354 RepID=B0EK88_ENTDS|nr:ribosomal RNA methyltransferase, putative [Entamoeba dispar SAW760]EDR25052.1 ribosomal RNA methyltransferase, putative [Entamoeba dispar SAW760]|eukprot:EDR25052.1 ribosomal RNA methyltransferase, putative [Entamoeba dispar SAW760]
MGKEGKAGKERLDKYYHLAKQYGYRARSAFKLVQMNKRYDFLSSAHILIDLCAAPGGWCQVATKEMPVESKIFGVDLEPILPIPRCTTYVGDITTGMCFAEMKKLMKGEHADVVLHDGSPNMGKSWIQDAYTQSELCIAALKFAVTFLKKGGWFISKVFRSQDYYAILFVFEKFFKSVIATKPPASRNTSAEVYLVCKDFLAPSKYDPNLLDPKFVFAKEEETQVPDLFSTKRPKPQGYDTSKALVYNIGNAKEFLQAEDPKAWLATHTAIQFDEGLPVTEDIKGYGSDIRMLGSAELKLLLKWRDIIVKKIKKEQEEADKIKAEEEKMKIEDKVLTEQEELQKELEREEEEEREEEIAKNKKTAKQKRAEEKKKRKEQRIKEGGMDIANSSGYDEVDQLFSIDDLKNQQDLDNFFNMTNPVELEEEEEQRKKEEEENEKRAEQERLEQMTYDQRLDEQFEREYKEFLERRGKVKVLAKVGEMKRSVMVQSSLNDGDIIRQADQKPREEVIEEVDDVVHQKGILSSEGKNNKEDLWWSRHGMDDISVQMGILEEVLKKDQAKEEKLKGEVKNEIDDKYEEEVQGEDQVMKEESDEEENEVIVSEDGESDEYEETEDSNKDSKSSEEDDEINWGPHMGKEKLSQALIVAGRIVKDPKQKKRLLEQHISRWTLPEDEDTPAWFRHEEEEHNKLTLPETKEEVAAMRRRLREIDSTPIKKAWEAEARKKKKLQTRMRALEQQASKIEGDGEMNSKEQLRILSKKAKKLNKKFSVHEGVRFVSSKTGKTVGGSSGRMKLVDPRMKKELRAKKRIEKGKTKKGGKGKKSFAKRR